MGESGPEFVGPPTPHEAANRLFHENVELRKEIGKDSLTGLANREAFQHTLTHALSLVERGTEQSIALLFIDLDHFKRLNDTFGHPVGDMVLKTVAILMRTEVRATDEVARLGGEEFGIIMRGASKADALKHAQEILEKIDALAFADHPDVHMTASIGVAASEDSRDADMLYKFADDATYQAKKAGRNQVVAYATPTV